MDSNGNPFPILGRASWYVMALNDADRATYLSDTTSRGYNAIEFHVLDHNPTAANPPRDGGNNLPFTKRLDGATWSGALTYGNAAVEAPDMTTPNPAYWANVDSLISQCQSQGILVFMFPAYVGYMGGDQGWMVEMTANGASRVQQYGAFIANRYKNSPNIVWMMGGDKGSFDASQDPVEHALRTGLDSVAGQASKFFSAEWDSGMIATDQQNYGAMTLNGVYSWTGQIPSLSQNAYAFSPVEPAFLLEEPYDEEGPDGNDFNPNAIQPVRRFQWWGALGTIGGYISGNGFIWKFNSGWQSHLDTQGSRDMARLNAFIRSVAWQKLVPQSVGGMKQLVTANGGTVATADWVGAAASPDGKLLVAYVPPAHVGSITVDMTAMAPNSRARWFNPTSAVYTAIASSLPNTGTQVFTPPADNGTGFTDWVLVLDVTGTASAPPTISGIAASPATVTGTTSSLSVTASDDGGAANLTYAWSATGTPPAGVTFSPNGTNAAASTVATFAKAGTYTLQAVVTDADGQTVTRTVNVTVNQTLTSIGVSPTMASVAPSGTQAFTAATRDQFGLAMASQPSAFTWSVSGGGTMATNGTFAAGTAAGGPFTITAASGTLSGHAQVTVAASQSVVYHINAGGSAVSPFTADQFFSGGTAFTSTNVVSTAGVANAAPAAVYQSERYGNMTYTLPSLTPGGAYTVRLHFAEIFWTQANARLFNVAINGAQVLMNFDIFAQAGGANKAVVRDFSATADAGGKIAVVFTTVVDNAKLSGVEVLSSAPPDQAPTVQTAAQATPSPITGTTTQLSVLGQDNDGGGEPALTYTWATTSTPPAAVTFSANGSNAAKNVTATFSKAGLYALEVTIADAQGMTATSTVNVTVNATPTTIVVSPSSVTLAAGATQQFSASAQDQFGVALSTQPSFDWTTTCGGTISASGLFTAGSTAGGPFTVRAASGAVGGNASVTNSGSVADTQAPSVPSGVSAVATGPTAINVSWSASTDNVGVTGYIVLRCTGATCTPTTQVGTPAGTSFSDSGLAPSTTYRYAVKARDAAGNTSGASAIAGATTPAASSAIQFVQVAAATPQSPSTSLSVAYPSAQTLGNFNIVVVGWNSGVQTINSVTDSNGNVYQVALALGRGNGMSQAIYYAPAIKAGANSVSVTWSGAVDFPDVRVLEYSGLSAAVTVNQTATATGNSTVASAGPVSATGPNQLVFAAGMTAWSFGGATGAFTTRIITQPDNDIAEDLITTAAGASTASASVPTSAVWLFQVVSFQ